MGKSNSSNKQSVVLMVGIIIALAVFGSALGMEASNEGFNYLRF